MLILQMILFSNAAHEMGKLTFPIKNLQLKVMLISTNLLTFQEQMSNVEKKRTVELISKDK